ncbi:lysine-sensitive aspartokinase 3 [bacterium]|nr:lysine-sensitive aspartokinase 3 [bacterium]
MKVLKFGGTSVKDAQAMKHVADILSHYPPVTIVVLSATAGTTDTLIKLVFHATEGQHDAFMETKQQLVGKHYKIIDDLGLKMDRSVCESVDEIFSTLSVFLEGIYLLRESTNRVKDAVVASGELLSTHIFAAYLKTQYPDTAWFDVRNVITTDDHFGSAHVDLKTSQKRYNQKMKPLLKRNRFIITQGFLGSTLNGLTTTLGRGGSDYSATLIGNLSNAESIEIWTDSDGVMTADPRFIPQAFSQRELSFKEAAELSYFGAKVLHPYTMLPAMEKNLPVQVKNTMKPKDPGTVIAHESRQIGQPKSIAFRRNITTVTIESSRMLNAYGFLERIFDVFARYQISIDLVSTSEISVSLTLEKTEYLDKIVQELKAFASVRISDKMAIVSIVGEDIKNSQSFLKRAFYAVDIIPIEMISFGASNVNLSFVISEMHVETVVKKLHREFFESGKNESTV